MLQNPLEATGRNRQTGPTQGLRRPATAREAARVSRQKKRRDRSADGISGIARALSHPLRVRILERLVSERASAKSLSEEMGVPLGNVAYHLRVLYEECEVTELVATRQVRGAVERFYRLKPRASFDHVDYSGVPPVLLNGLRGSMLQSFVDASVTALGNGSMDSAEDTTFTGLAVTVDRQGWAEVNAAMREAVEKVERAEIRSRGRVADGDPGPTVSAIVGAAAFQAVRRPAVEPEALGSG